MVLDEARESYAPEIVHELQSRTEEDLVANVARVQQWIACWVADQASGRGRVVGGRGGQRGPEEGSSEEEEDEGEGYDEDDDMMQA